jgi:vancomycin resistance protein YoaR
MPAPNGGQSGFLKPLTGAIQRVAGTRWAPVRPDAPPAPFAHGPAGTNGPGAPAGPGGPGGPAGPGGPNAPGGPDAAGQGGFYGLAGDGAPSRGPKIALFTVLAAVLLFGIYALVAWTQSDTTPRDTTVAGVNIGGMTEAEAVSALTEQLAPRVKEPIALTAGEGKAQLSPEPSGLAIDAEATAAELTGFSLNPAHMWAHMFGGSEEELVLAVDDKKFDAAVAGLEDSLAVDAVDGTVGFVDGQPVKTDPKEGSQIVASETARIIKERWINEEGPFDLPVEKVAPKITQQETDAGLAVAQKVVSAPVTVSVGGQTPVLAPEQLAGLFRFEQRKGKLVTIVDREATVGAVVDGTTDLLELPDDAHFEFVGGRPTPVEGKTGTTLDPVQAGKAVRIAATTDDRETSVELVEQDPEETVESLEKLGVKEVVSEFHTPLTNEPVRTQNLVRGAQMITGNLVKPGETFSLLEALAPITLENGYFDAGVVENGEHVEAVGGGLSQMATTTFNAGFFAGYEDVEHHAHSYWFPRYPPGREATIYVGAKDMKFTNDTPYGAVLQSYVAGGELWVKIWSTKHYTVEESNTGKQNVVSKTVIHDSSADCKPYPGGEDGFSIGITRKVFLNGQLAKENSFNHSYNPDNPVVCD